jgi:bifunctional non-homologous end joining protein LigD
VRRPDRVLFPETGFRKSDAIDYYRRVAKFILPHLRNRPVSLKRYPDTVNGESFWEKDAPSFTPAWVKRFAVPRRSGESAIEYIVINDVRTLTWVAEVGGIEIHPFLHRIPKIEEATHVVFDLDPGPGATIVECCRSGVVARRLGRDRSRVVREGLRIQRTAGLRAAQQRRDARHDRNLRAPRGRRAGARAPALHRGEDDQGASR